MQELLQWNWIATVKCGGWPAPGRAWISSVQLKRWWLWPSLPAQVQHDLTAPHRLRMCCIEGRGNGLSGKPVFPQLPCLSLNMQSQWGPWGPCKWSMPCSTSLAVMRCLQNSGSMWCVCLQVKTKSMHTMEGMQRETKPSFHKSQMALLITNSNADPA